MKAIVTLDDGTVIDTVELFKDPDFFQAFTQRNMSSHSFLQEKKVFESDAQEAFHSAIIPLITKCATELHERTKPKS